MKLDTAQQQAIDVRSQLDGCTHRWEFAGSLRRQRENVGDIEHIVIPRFGEVKLEGEMFPAQDVNLLNFRLDAMLREGEIEKALYGEKRRTRWGVKTRSFVLNGCRHEIYTANLDTWGVVMAIRTGPATLSTRLVTEIKLRGHEVRDGNQVFPNGRDRPISVKTEKLFFDLCGVTLRPPHQRMG